MNFLHIKPASVRGAKSASEIMVPPFVWQSISQRSFFGSGRASIFLAWIACLFVSFTGLAAPVMRVVQTAELGTNRLRNAGFEQGTTNAFTSWQAAPKGYRVARGEGRSGSQALACAATDNQGWYGANQTLTLNRTNIAPIIVQGWSRAENVDGNSDSDYSLYVDITYRDGTPLWGQTGNFSSGTHDWESRRFVIWPQKPVQSLRLYCLFRGHSGKVWFDDVSVQENQTSADAFLFQGTPMTVEASTGPPSGQPSVFQTDDGFKMTLTGGWVTQLSVDGRELAGTAPSGFLARDAAANSDVFAFEDGACPALKLNLSATVTAKPDHVVIEGRLTDTTGGDRAIMLFFALPIDAQDWLWSDDIRRRRTVAGIDEFSNSVLVNCGVNGMQSIYPLACVNDERSGVALGVDMSKPAQFRLVYHAGTRQLLLAYDFGLVKETAQFPSGAEFRFVLYCFDPRWGFRAAFDKFTNLFPEHFKVRSAEQGIWMPFTDIATVQDWQDFGFRYHEGNNNVRFDDQHGILSFRYTEPMTWWMPMAPSVPRTEAAALEARDSVANSAGSDQQAMAKVSVGSAMWDASGQPSLLFLNEPWANGAVWSLNPNPLLPASPNAATVYWNDSIRKSLYGSNAVGVLDGEYLDSLEGYVTSDLNFRREHFAYSTVPLTFATETARPALWKALAVYEFTHWISDEVHRLGKLCFANGVPNRFGFLCSQLDVLGMETDWLSNGQYAPASHEQMSLWRTLAGKKPYLLLMNTDFDLFGSDMVERYFQQSLFYGMFPSMFSHNAADNPYWQTPRWYNRDRALFQRYQPIIKEVAQAGWQPITLATSDNTNLFIERFGPAPDGSIYFTLLNESASTQSALLRPSFDPPENGQLRTATELISGATLKWSWQGWQIELQPQSCAAVKVWPPLRFLNVSIGSEGRLELAVAAPLGATLVLEVSDNLADWRPIGTNTINLQPFIWFDQPSTGTRFYRLRR